MQDNANSELPAPKHMPWNKGKLTGAKPTPVACRDAGISLQNYAMSC